MSNLSREEAIIWCYENKCDFILPTYPTPPGWIWANSFTGMSIILTANQINEDGCKDISYFDLIEYSRKSKVYS